MHLLISFHQNLIVVFLCYKLVKFNSFLFNISIELILDEKPDVDYSDIGGLDLQKQEIREAVELPLTHFGKFSQLKIIF